MQQLASIRNTVITYTVQDPELLCNNFTNSIRKYPDYQKSGNGQRMRVHLIAGLVLKEATAVSALSLTLSLLIAVIIMIIALKHVILFSCIINIGELLIFCCKSKILIISMQSQCTSLTTNRMNSLGKIVSIRYQ